ncbi:hypothetical protein [Actinocrispum wychmicini]|uniref:Uncharacterized protein n=1 Tax=Actinocrispum wychmicini TaxID=1213861 RepID=A0A4R2J9M7_9PSEU|nr:hypothetical protein [Actinocrispum wychmicini]TCO56041.1 hypothetical protein EV192_107466 [Actinocrispum wychmicini]
MGTWSTAVDPARFGPWALVTGASSGIGRGFAERGVNVTVLLPGATATPMLARFGADRTAMGRLAMSVDACVADALKSLRANRAVRVSGRMNRLMMLTVPRSARTRLMGALGKSMAGAVVDSRGTVQERS